MNAKFRSLEAWFRKRLKLIYLYMLGARESWAMKYFGHIGCRFSIWILSYLNFIMITARKMFFIKHSLTSGGYSLARSYMFNWMKSFIAHAHIFACKRARFSIKVSNLLPRYCDISFDQNEENLGELMKGRVVKYHSSKSFNVCFEYI